MNKSLVIEEVKYKAIRSSGAGGQHVNKVSSKVVLTWDVMDSQGISEEERSLLLERLASRLTKEGKMVLSCDTTRSQIKNKEIVTARLIEILVNGLKISKVRKATKVSKGALQRRKENNKKLALKKALRKRVDF